MDNHQRPYQPVRVDMIGVENGFNRFTKDGITNMPPVARWRNNLTALSQYENLFFIASGDCIAVYQPEFPYQTLNRNPALLIRPELANRFAIGYMSQHRSNAEEHCINHLITGELGSQEILLLATDSGNVEAYYTSSVLNAIQDIKRNGLDGRYADVVGLQPFFKHWVYQSAWGLDIHKDARMIAVSSNVPNTSQPAVNEDADNSATITVFAFALEHSSTENDDGSDQDDGESMLDAEWTVWSTACSTQTLERDRNYKVLLQGHDGHANNIPNISFVNTAEDTGGTWLLSTDITGIMKLWQIWKGKCIRQWDFSSEGSRIGHWAHASYPGWNVAALDVGIFRPVKTKAEFIGADRAPVHPGYHDRGPSFNLTSIARQIPENSRYHPLHSPPLDTDNSSGVDVVFNNQDIDDEDPTPTGQDAIEGVQTTPFPSADAQEIQVERSELSTAPAFNPELEFEFEQEDDESEVSSSEVDDYSDDDGESFGTEENAHLLTLGNPRISHLMSKVRPYEFPNVSVPRMAIIHCSNTHIRMLGSPKARYPHIFCANIVRQILPEDILNTQPGAEMQFMDRLNMIQKIPELGILLVATQAGRAAVCSLTRQDDLLGFRVDWVLPTKKQERSGRRPHLCALIGMAVAPIQGRGKHRDDAGEEDERMMVKDGVIDGVKTTFDPNMVVLRHRPTSKERQAQKAGKSVEPKLEARSWESTLRDIPAWQAVEHSTRYRVMLTYTDLSVLTYEISRNIERSHEAE